MSWSFNATGKPDRVVAAMNKYGDSLSGVSKEEFDAVKGGLEIAIKANSCNGPTEHVKVEASGGGSKVDGAVNTSARILVEPYTIPIV